MKIYLSPSDQTENQYSVGNTNEAEQAEIIAKKLESALLRCQFEVKRNLTGVISKGVTESNHWGADYHVCLHTNAFNGEIMGTRLFSWDYTGKGHQACEAIMKFIAPITPGTSDNITPWPTLYEMRNAAAWTVYIEIGFHDTPIEAQWIIDHPTEIAEAICKGMCECCNMPYVDNKLYKVQIGAFSDYENAVAQLNRAKNYGFTDAFIVNE